MNDEDIVVTTTIETGVHLNKIEAIFAFIFFMICLFTFGYLLDSINKSSGSSENVKLEKPILGKK